MFGTALNYICLRMLGQGLDGGEDNVCARARKWIQDHGGVTCILSWGKTCLLILGVYDWSSQSKGHRVSASSLLSPHSSRFLNLTLFFSWISLLRPSWKVLTMLMWMRS
ncbi:hypothetical protein Syun_024950 [Stephania yunnanensis]|uniref:Squalene cyclase N-terminal domain-containing protein n=1 Tax=Stephania yunnanensis TaxID=152371 RepID=A0AAP0HVS7_9MAGN